MPHHKQAKIENSFLRGIDSTDLRKLLSCISTASFYPIVTFFWGEVFGNTLCVSFDQPNSPYSEESLLVRAIKEKGYDPILWYDYQKIKLAYDHDTIMKSLTIDEWKTLIENTLLQRGFIGDKDQHHGRNIVYSAYITTFLKNIDAICQLIIHGKEIRPFKYQEHHPIEYSFLNALGSILKMRSFPDPTRPHTQTIFVIPALRHVIKHRTPLFSPFNVFATDTRYSFDPDFCLWGPVLPWPFNEGEPTPEQLRLSRQSPEQFLQTVAPKLQKPDLQDKHQYHDQLFIQAGGKTLRLVSVFDLKLLVDYSLKTNLTHRNNKDRYLLWTGFGEGGESISQQFAKEWEKITIEMTDLGNFLQIMLVVSQLTVSFERRAAWIYLSTLFAQSVRGRVVVLIGPQGKQANSIYTKYEFPYLVKNQHVTQVTEFTHNELQEERTLPDGRIWRRYKCIGNTTVLNREQSHFPSNTEETEAKKPQKTRLCSEEEGFFNFTFPVRPDIPPPKITANCTTLFSVAALRKAGLQVIDTEPVCKTTPPEWGDPSSPLTKLVKLAL